MAEQNKLKNLEKLRSAHGFTVEELMIKLGKDENCRNTYYYWLRTGQIKTLDLIKLHDLFGVSTDCILDITPLTISG